MQARDDFGWVELEQAESPVRPARHRVKFWCLVAILLVCLAASVYFSHNRFVRDQPYWTLAKSQIALYEVQLTLFNKDTGQYPTDQQGLRALSERPTEKPMKSGRWRGPYTETEVRTDPWGHRYQYNLFNGKPWILSAGPDGRFFTKDDISNLKELPGGKELLSPTR